MRVGASHKSSGCDGLAVFESDIVTERKGNFFWVSSIYVRPYTVKKTTARHVSEINDAGIMNNDENLE